MTTLQELIERHGVDVDEHLARDLTIPALSGPQRQGDVIVVPLTFKKLGVAIEVPREGVPVVRGENGGNTHLLIGEGPVTWRPALDTGTLDLGVVSVPEGSIGVLAHPEHGYNRIAPGDYVIRRQRELADEIRQVAD